MRFFTFLFTAQFFINGQILPTVPSNVFRISLGTNTSETSWDLEDNRFSLQGIGRKYFDHMTHNDSIRFSSNFDLYHTGTVYIDSINTVEDWMTNFNTMYGFSLPTLGSQNIDTTKGMSPEGIFSERRKKKVTGRRLNIEYGMSNEITLSASIPIIDSYIVDQSFSDYSIGSIQGAQILVDYHQDARQQFNSFMNSNTFSNLRRGLKDTLELIYNMYYTNNGDYSVKWALHSQDDPINNLLVDQAFLPPGINKDSVSLSDLVSYYYPAQKQSKGIDDVEIGATALLSGTPTWALESQGDAVYGQVFISIPYGNTLSQFLDSRRKQFKEIDIGKGVSRISVGLYGSKNLQYKYIGRVYGQFMGQFSSTTTLNTPALLFSGGHSHPDSILSLVGNSYKFDLGNGIRFNLGAEVERFKNRLRIRGEICTIYKGQDNYISKDPDWDRWMEQFAGNSPSYNRSDLKVEIWLMNSLSKYRFGPIPFDLYAGAITTLAANNIDEGWKIYAGITTYYQGW